MGLLKAIFVFACSAIITMINNNIVEYKDNVFIKPIYPMINKCNILVFIIFLMLILFLTFILSVTLNL